MCVFYSNQATGDDSTHWEMFCCALVRRVCVRASKCGRKAPLVTSQVLFRNTMGGEIALMEKRLMWDAFAHTHVHTHEHTALANHSSQWEVEKGRILSLTLEKNRWRRENRQRGASWSCSSSTYFMLPPTRVSSFPKHRHRFSSKDRADAFI